MRSPYNAKKENVGARHASPETAGAGIIDGGLRMRSPYNANKDIVGARHASPGHATDRLWLFSDEGFHYRWIRER